MSDFARRGLRPIVVACLGFGFILSLLGTVQAGAPDAIPWRLDFSRAQAEARAEGRPIWLQFTGPWCGYCRQMEREAFHDPGIVASARDRFIPVRVQSDLREDLAEKFELEALPTTLILLPSGAVIARHEGYADPVEFGTFLDGALERFDSSGLARRRVPDQTMRRGEAEGEGDAVALAGYCPVAMVQGGRLSTGQASLALRHEGREYWFASAEHREVFRKRPDAFLPANHGYCVVNQVDRGKAVDGDPRFGVLYRNRVYLCADEAARDRFARDPEKYSSADAIHHAGRRYLFPDVTHREAFLAAPDQYVR